MRKKNNAGFTLIELVVTLVCCSIVTLAVMTVLLTGTRIGRAAEESSGEQQTVRIVLTALENMISDGTVRKVEESYGNWKLLDESGSVLLSYSRGQGALLTSGGTPLLEGLANASAELSSGSGDEDDEDSDEIKNLLTITVEIDGEEYETTVYCRIAPRRSEDNLNSVDDVKGKVNAWDNNSQSEDIQKTYNSRTAFLLKLASQHKSTGNIDGVVGNTYSLWYCGGQEYWDGWNANTPWCAIFLSWAMNEISEEINGDVPKFSNVNDGAQKFGWKNSDNKGDFGKWKTTDPIPGDLVFFDWELDKDPDHVGVVLALEQNGNGEVTGIFTIEGNSGKRVAVNYYSIDSACIMGYGVLNWKTDSTT